MASALLPSSSWSSSMALPLSAASLPRLLRVVPLLLLAPTAEAPLPTTATAVGSSTAGPTVVATRTIIVPRFFRFTLSCIVSVGWAP